MTSLYTPKYITLQNVKIELQDKITFSNTDSEYMSDNEVLDNIEDGEASIERMLSRQYIIDPGLLGVDINGNVLPFNEITQKSTIKYIEKLCTLQTCLFIMETEFGKSEGVRGTGYLDHYQKRLDRLMYDVLGKDRESGQWLYPPFPGLLQDPNSSYYEKGIPFPMVALLGITSPSLTRQVIQRMPNPVRTWWIANNKFGTWIP